MENNSDLLLLELLGRESQGRARQLVSVGRFSGGKNLMQAVKAGTSIHTTNWLRAVVTKNLYYVFAKMAVMN